MEPNWKNWKQRVEASQEEDEESGGRIDEEEEVNNSEDNTDKLSSRLHS